MSLGGGASTTLDDAVTNSISSGVTYAIAAGNDNANACKCVPSYHPILFIFAYLFYSYSPARVSAAITVGSTTNTDGRSSFSNYGNCTNIFAPGTSITSDWIGANNNATNVCFLLSFLFYHIPFLLLSFFPRSFPLLIFIYFTHLLFSLFFFFFFL